METVRDNDEYNESYNIVIYKQYAFTIKLNWKSMPKSGDYYKIIDKWEKQGVIVRQIVYELDEARRLHAHGILQVDKSFFLGKLKTKGLHTFFVEIEDSESLFGWVQYIEKQYENRYQQEQLLQTNDIQVSKESPFQFAC